MVQLVCYLCDVFTFGAVADGVDTTQVVVRVLSVRRAQLSRVLEAGVEADYPGKQAETSINAGSAERSARPVSVYH